MYGFSEGVAARLAGHIHDDESDTGGIGGTLAGNALSMAAMRATLEHVLTEDAFRCDNPTGPSLMHMAGRSFLM